MRTFGKQSLPVVAVAWLLLAAFLAGCNSDSGEKTAGKKKDNVIQSQAVSGGVHVGETLGDVSGKDLDGNEFKLSEYRGKVVMLDFWSAT